MKDDGDQSKEAFEERLQALFRERYGAIFADLSPQEVKAVQAKLGVRPDRSAVEEERMTVRQQGRADAYRTCDLGCKNGLVIH